MPAVKSKAAELLPDDILSAVLVLAQRKRGAPLRFRGHDFELQRVFNKLAKEFATLRQCYVFSSTGPVPYSPVLNDSISRLQLSGLIGRENPDYEWVFLRPAADNYYSAVLAARIESEVRGELEAAADAFLKEVNA